jgi:LPS sulfotransferase NodH
MEATSRKKSRDRDWAPRIWEGCNVVAWWRLLSRNGFDVDRSHLYMVPIITFVSSMHTLLRFFEESLYRHQIRRVNIKPPLFIVGHWRSGTTLLHELLVEDPKHGFPNTYQCLEPNHFILTEAILTRLFAWVLPGRRPMDNMAAGWDRPQEDEFALCMLGEHSPYLTIAFPNHKPIDQEFLDLELVSASDRRRWKQTLYSFFQKVAFKDGRRLVLKSPTHTARVRILLEMFPDAQFVHITRNPYVIFPSTMNLWKSFYRKHGLQNPTFEGLEEYVFSTFVRMYERFEADRPLLREGQLHELKYEDLVRDPFTEIRKLYEHLNLGPFDRIRPGIQAYFDRTRGYETNKYEISPELKAEITRRWGRIIERLGYPLE